MTSLYLAVVVCLIGYTSQATLSGEFKELESGKRLEATRQLKVSVIND